MKINDTDRTEYAVNASVEKTAIVIHQASRKDCFFCTSTQAKWEGQQWKTVEMGTSSNDNIADVRGRTDRGNGEAHNLTSSSEEYRFRGRGIGKQETPNSMLSIVRESI